MIKTIGRAAGARARLSLSVDVAFHIKDAICEGAEIRFPRLGTALRSSRLTRSSLSLLFPLLPLFPFILSSIATRGGASSITETPPLSPLPSPPFVVHPKRSLE